MKLGHFSVNQSVLLNLMMVLITVGGILAFKQLPRDLFPDVSTDALTVTTVMPGASPKEIEQLITTPIEEEIRDVQGIDEMVSISSGGISSVILKFQPGIKNFFEKLTEVQNEVNKVKDLPTDAERPNVAELRLSFEVVTVCVMGSAPESELKKFSENLEDELRRVNGVAEVNLYGVRERQLWVETDPKRLEAYGLSLAQVADALRKRNLNLPAGQIKMGRAEFDVRTQAEYANLNQMLETVLKEDGKGGYVYLRDVAGVRDTFEDAHTLSRLDGQPAVTLVVKKDKASNLIKIAEKVRKVVDQFAAQAPAGVTLKLIDDRSKEVAHQMKSLYSNLLSGLVLILVMLTIFIGWRASALVAHGMVIALLGTFILLVYLGYTINMLSLFGLIMVLGMLCDDAIVVCENVYRYYEAGLPIREAAIRGTDEIAWAVIASSGTTVAAFLPLLMMSGVLGRFMAVIPVVVSLALGVSLIEALLILPTHIDEMGVAKKKHGVKQKGMPAYMVRGIRGYEWLVGKTIAHRYLVISGMFAAAVAISAYAAKHVDFILFGGRDLLSFALTVETAPGASLQETERVLKELEAKAVTDLRKIAPEIEYIRTTVGDSGANSRPGPPRAAGANTGEVRIQLVPLYERERLGQVIREEYRKLVQDATGYRVMNFEDRTTGPPVGKAVQVRVRGENFDTLQEIVKEIKTYLATIDGVTDILDNFPPGKDEVRPDLDLEKLAGAGLDVRAVATEVRGAFDGLLATTVHDADEELDVMVKYAPEHRRSVNTLEDMVFPTADGMVPFGVFGKMKRVEGYSQISHYDGKRTISVLADVLEGKTTSKKVNEQLIEHFKGIEKRHPGYSLSFGGEFEDIQESLDSLMRSFIVAIILVFVIMGGIFKSYIQPMIVMVTVPFGFVGVVLGFSLLREPMGMFAIVGSIGLAGIVVNNAIVLIDFINERRRMGSFGRDAIVEAGGVRLRPILLTSGTTILGLGPIAINLFGVDPLMKPMATAISSGLIFATILTLVVIPCVYSIFDDMAVYLTGRPLGVSKDLFERFTRPQADQDETLPGRDPFDDTEVDRERRGDLAEKS